MATRTKNQEQARISPDAAVAGILALLIDAREIRIASDKDAVRTEILLARAGLSIDEIAAATGKKYDAVRMAIQRGKSK